MAAHLHLDPVGGVAGDMFAAALLDLDPSLGSDLVQLLSAAGVSERVSIDVVIDARELQDPRYVANPSNRCFFCKSDLYGTIASVIDTGTTICSGTNLDDLDDFRPGLQAAAAHKVMHPFVEAGMRKKDVRNLAAALGLAVLADAPASPCLSSRVETGIEITPQALMFIDAVETIVRQHGVPVVRCRLRASGIVIECGTPPRDQPALVSELQPLLAGRPVTFAAYRQGSAFL